MDKKIVYNDTININGDSFPNFDIRKHRQENILFKQRYYESMPIILDEVLTVFFNNESEMQLDFNTMHDDEVAEHIIDLVQVSSLINTLDFLIPCPISSYSASVFYKYKVFLRNIYYTKDENSNYQDYKPLVDKLGLFTSEDFNESKFILKL